ncbi:ATP-binding protein [Oceanobacillus sp. FSL K6-2867]|uniref:HAMP domain-containing sensor histidine kinase n=1 Tax=Oceanobacillus sp. FSL K6-2867 TaxID=2954748 RepID=UPI0030DA7552
MLRSKLRSIFFPNQFIFLLTFINIAVTAVFVALSSWAIYNTACLLADGMLSMTVQKQNLFESTLYQYLWVFSLCAVFLGGLIHYYLTKKVTEPLKKLIFSTKKMKQGQYVPISVTVKRDGEIGELINHFNELAQQLETNEKQRRKLVSDLSHEFRTPLTNLNGYLRALQSGILEGDERLYQALYEESSKLTQLVEQIEKLKEWDDMAERTVVEKEAVNMKEFIGKSVKIFHWTLEQNDMDLVLDVESSIVAIDSTSISQVMSNLLDNAIRYYKGTGPIIIKGEKLPSEYKVSVTGPGRIISKADRERIFDRFYRTEKSRSRKLGGSGLGLAISKEIVERHNGKIGLQSESDIHTFWFVLPHLLQTTAHDGGLD